MRGPLAWWRSRSSSEPRIAKDAIPFQVGIDVIIAEHPSVFLMSTFYLVLLFLGLIVLVASVMKVDMVVMGTGRLTTETPPLQLQPMDRAIVRELKVKAGDHVTRGQILATMDSTFVHADLATLLAQKQAIQAQIRRLESEINNTPFVLGGTPNVDERLQSALMEQRQAQYKSRLQMFGEEIQRIQANMRTTEDDREALGKLLKISREVEGMRQTLKKAGTGSQLQHQDSQVVRIRTEQSHQEASNRLVEMKHNLQAKKAERQTFIDEWSRQLLDQLISSRAELAKLNENVIKASRMSDMEVMTAPVDGTVLDVAKRATGSVLNPAELLITLVPADAVMIADVMIGASDVGYVKNGDKVTMKVNAFPYQKFGVLEGELSFISQESFQSGNELNRDFLSKATASAGGQAFHVGRVKLTKKELKDLPEGAQLIRGMTLTYNIPVGTRRLITYFLYTMTSIFDESFRER
ncbi:MAG: HlyD family type I secretion periplasmic adaptor subunit [Magnetococcales bacterium]|nr:HlyD family type I secretion periplasmic adaptor subunit [Magnetococcales bacterium]